MGSRQVDPRQQFSKKLAGRTELFWFVYMLVLVAAIVITPDAALPAVYLGIMVTGVMVVSVLAYTKNSIDEKWFYWAAEIAKAVHGGSVEKNADGNEDRGNG